MKITETNQGGTVNNTNVGVADRKVITNPADSFSTRLSKAASDNYQVRLAGILNEIQNQAEKLSRKVDIRELKTYKRLISDFLDEAVNNSHKFMRENKLDRRGRHRVYAIIKQVNEKLEDLTQEVLKEEKDNLAVLQKLDDIRGLLLDITT